MIDPLPGHPGPALKAVWEALEPAQGTALLVHLHGNTSAEWIAWALAEEGYKVSASTVRSYRRRLEHVKEAIA